MADQLELVPHITLAAAADCGNGTFAVCGDEGRALWYGPFLDSDSDHPHGDRFAGAMAAASRAVWLAGRARADSGHREATLHLTVTEPDMDAVTLACTASLSGLALDLEVSDDNPAVDWCQVFGRLDWNPGALINLLDAELSEGEQRRHLRTVATYDDSKESSAMTAQSTIDPAVELRAALEALLLHDSIGFDARMRHAVAAVVHLAVDTPHGPPEDAEEFLGRLDASWLLAAWTGHDSEMSLIATLAAGEVPTLSWCELMFTTALAPWSTSPVAVHARRIFASVQHGRLGAVRQSVRVSGS
ncbi:hypothetical protein [Nocardia bovistercoris]|uniref:DUF4192 family protein n=1 Tax=Nocardia bovistercoris TaxID=2785916 RepID=A0A931I6T9_9NOCA|nr:hypothetical protein [Nocardia bovistercoris]MBH0775689.1 hypothetical protein [Nocardia bovistercoris]